MFTKMFPIVKVPFTKTFPFVKVPKKEFSYLLLFGGKLFLPLFTTKLNPVVPKVPSGEMTKESRFASRLWLPDRFSNLLFLPAPSLKCL